MSPANSRSARLQADCAKCCGLCCVAPAFDADQGFGISKPARVPCPNLGIDSRCAIHAELRARGFAACATFDCYGAGQRVTQGLFGGTSWRASPEVAEQMFNAYFRYRALHELMAILELVIERVPPPQSVPLRECFRRIDGFCESGEALAQSVHVGAMRREVRDLLQRVLRRP